MTKQISTFYMFYDGPAHSDHEMDILEVADSLKGLGTLFHETNNALNGGNTSLNVKVHAGFVQGSFGIEVQVIQEMLNNSKDILPFIGIGTTMAGATLLEVVSKLRGRNVDSFEERDDGTFDLKVGDEIINCSEDIQKTLEYPSVRKAIDTVMHRAMLAEGTETFGICLEDDSDPVFKISKADAPKYKAPKTVYRTKESSFEFDATIKFLTGHIDKAAGWRVEYNGNDIKVKIEDSAFITKLSENTIPNILGQYYRVSLTKTTKERTGAKDLDSYIISKVYHPTKLKS
ncbi:MAG: hypothetical protein OIF57_04655 [Marinobacterium sp.]|nr:hypothetical protein [Marinobacterium sp.]